MPVQFLGAGNVLHIVEQHILVALQQADGRRIEIGRHPVSADQAFGVGVALGYDGRIRESRKNGNWCHIFTLRRTAPNAIGE